MSEASPATHTCPLTGWKYGSIGVPLPNTESKVIMIVSGKKHIRQHMKDTCDPLKINHPHDGFNVR